MSCRSPTRSAIGGAVADQRGAILRTPDAAVQAAAAEIFGAVTAVAGREESDQRVERGVERGRVAAAGVGEADERGHLRRPVVQAPRLRHDQPQERVGAAHLAASVGHAVQAETSAHRPPVRPLASSRQEIAKQPLGAFEVVGLAGEGAEAECRRAIGAVAVERVPPADRYPVQAVVLQGALGGVDDAFGIGLALERCHRARDDEEGKADEAGET